MTDEMPKTIWAKAYEASTGHGEWEDYEPFQEGFSVKYTNTEALIAELEVMKKLLPKPLMPWDARDAGYNAAIDAVIEKVMGDERD